jgi:hypothetical protein
LSLNAATFCCCIVRANTNDASIAVATKDLVDFI